MDKYLVLTRHGKEIERHLREGGSPWVPMRRVENRGPVGDRVLDSLDDGEGEILLERILPGGRCALSQRFEERTGALCIVIC